MEKYFNHRHSSLRIAIEQAFGILVSRFRVLSTAMNIDVGKAEAVVEACITLHNFLLSKNIENSTVDTDYNAERPLPSPKQIRDNLAKYFYLQRLNKINQQMEWIRIRLLIHVNTCQFILNKRNTNQSSIASSKARRTFLNTRFLSSESSWCKVECIKLKYDFIGESFAAGTTGELTFSNFFFMLLVQCCNEYIIDVGARAGIISFFLHKTRSEYFFIVGFH